MRAALESGSLVEVNKMLGMINIPEAENMVGLLGDVSACQIKPLLNDCLLPSGPIIGWLSEH